MPAARQPFGEMRGIGQELLRFDGTACAMGHHLSGGVMRQQRAKLHRATAGS